MKLFTTVLICHLLLVCAFSWSKTPTNKSATPNQIAVNTYIIKQPELTVQSPPSKPAKAKEPRKNEQAVEKKVVEKKTSPTTQKQKASSTAKTTESAKSAVSAKGDQKNKLLNLMQESLDSLDSSAKTLQSLSSKSSNSSASATKSVALQSEVLSAAKEYEDILVTFLKAHLELPDRVEVHLKLTLKRSGEIEKLEKLESTSSDNIAYLNRLIPTLNFPPFSALLKNETSHTFSLLLTSEKSY